MQRSTGVASQSGLVAFFALASQGCGTHSPGDLDAAARQDASPEIASAQDARGGIVLPPRCGDEIASQAAARVTAAVPCFSGEVVNGCLGSSTVCARFDLGYDLYRGYVFRACDSESQGRIDGLEATATAALQGFETGNCALFAPISNPDFLRMKDTIIDCGGVYYAIVFDSTGSVAEVRGDTVTGGETRVLNCILAANGAVTLPCLADVELCSTIGPLSLDPLPQPSPGLAPRTRALSEMPIPCCQAAARLRPV